MIVPWPYPGRVVFRACRFALAWVLVRLANPKDKDRSKGSHKRDRK